MQATPVQSVELTQASAANAPCFNQVALGDQILSFQTEVKRYCLHFLKDAEQAQEVSQEVMLKAIKYAHQFESRASIKTWLFKIAYHACITQYRKTQVQQQRFVRLDDSNEEQIDFICQTPSFDDDNRETNPRLAQIVASLSVAQQAILRYRFVDDLSLVEIAANMNAKLSSVKMNYYRALEKINKLYVS